MQTRTLTVVSVALLAACASPRVGGTPASAPPRAAPSVLSTSETAVGEPLRYPEGRPRIRVGIVTLRPGERTPLHNHGVPMVAYLLEGELTVEYEGHARRVVHAGEALLEAMSVSHFGTNTGQGLVRILTVFIGAEGLTETLPR